MTWKQQRKFTRKVGIWKTENEADTEFPSQEEARAFASEKGSTLDSECHVRKKMSTSGFCLGYLHLDLSATGLASGPCPRDKGGKRKHIPSHIVHCDLQGSKGHFCLWHVHLLPLSCDAFNHEDFLDREGKGAWYLQQFTKSPLDLQFL